MSIHVRRRARCFAAVVLASLVVMSPTALAQAGSTSTSAEITCGTRPEGVTLPDAERDRFVSLWTPRVVDEVFLQNFVDQLTVPPEIEQEGFHALDATTEAWLISCLVDNVIAVHGVDGNPPGIAPSAARLQEIKAGLALAIFGKDEVNAIKAKAHETTPVSGDTPPTEAALNSVADALAHTVVPSVPHLSPADLPAPPDLQPTTDLLANTTDTLRELIAGSGLPVPVPGGGLETIPVPSPIPLPLPELRLADGFGGLHKFPPKENLKHLLKSLQKEIRNLPDTLAAGAASTPLGGATYRVCAESATMELRCTVPLPVGTPVPVDVTGDSAFDMLAHLTPVLNGTPITDAAVGFNLSRLPGSGSGPLASHVFLVYDPPTTGKRVQFGYDGRESTLSNETEGTVTVNDIAAAGRGDVRVQISLTHKTPGPVQAATVAVKALEPQGLGKQPLEHDPLVGAVQFDPVPDSLTVEIRIQRSATQDQNTVKLTSSNATRVDAHVIRDINASLPNTHQEVRALVDQLPTEVTVDIVRQGAATNVHYKANAGIAQVSASDTLVGDTTHPGSYVETIADVRGVPTDVNVKLTGGSNIQYRANEPVTKASFSHGTFRDNELQTSILGLVEQVPKVVDVNMATGGNVSTFTYDADSALALAKLDLFDRAAQKTSLIASASSLPTHAVFSQDKAKGVFDYSADGPIGAIEAQLSLNDGQILPLIGDHATLLKKGQGLGADFKLSGLQAAHFDPSESASYGLTLNPGGQGFTAIGDLDDPNVRATATISNLPSTMQVDLAPKTGKATWQASAPVASIAGLFQNRANGELVGAEINELPATIDLTYDAKNSAVDWNASAATGLVATVAKLGPSTGTARTHDASLKLTGIPAKWTAGFGGGHPRFEGVSGPIGTIESTFTNHGSVTTGPGDHLSAVFDAGSGDLDASLRISALSLADFQPLPNGFTGDLNMGDGSPFGLKADVRQGNTRLNALGTISTLPSAVHIESKDGVTIYTGNTNPTISLAAEYGNTAALAAADAAPLVHGLSVRDGAGCVVLDCGKGVKANLYLTGIPGELNFNSPTGVYTVKNFAPTVSSFVIDAELSALVPAPLRLKLTQAGIPSGVDFTYGPTSAATLPDGTETTHLGYTASSSLGKLTADAQFATDSAYFEASSVPSSLSIDTSFGDATKQITVTTGSAVDEVKAMYKHAGTDQFEAAVRLGDVPMSVNINIGEQDDGQGVATPVFTFTAGQPGLDISAFAAASLFGGDVAAEVKLDVVDLGRTLTADLVDKTLTITSSPATASFNLMASGRLEINDISLDFDAGPFQNRGQLDVLLDIFSLNVAFENLSSLTLTGGFTSAIQGNYGTFTVGERSNLELFVRDRLDVDTGVGVVTVIPTFEKTIDLDNVIGNFRLATDHLGRWFGIPTPIPCSIVPPDVFDLSINLRPHPHTTTSGSSFTVSPPGAAEGDAWLVTPNPLGALPNFVLDIIARFATPLTEDQGISLDC